MKNPVFHSGSPRRDLRGGSFESRHARRADVYFRNRINVYHPYSHLGFRLFYTKEK